MKLLIHLYILCRDKLHKCILQHIWYHDITRFEYRHNFNVWGLVKAQLACELLGHIFLVLMDVLCKSTGEWHIRFAIQGTALHTVLLNVFNKSFILGHKSHDLTECYVEGIVLAFLTYDLRDNKCKLQIFVYFPESQFLKRCSVHLAQWRHILFTYIKMTFLYD